MIELTVNEYGATVAVLMSDDVGCITGASLPVDGGERAIVPEPGFVSGRWRPPAR